MAIAEKAIEGALGFVAGEAFTRIRSELRRLKAVQVALESHGRPKKEILEAASNDVQQVLGNRKGQLNEALASLLTALRTSGLLSQLAEAAIILNWSESECELSLAEIAGLSTAFSALFSAYIKSDVYEFEGAHFTSDQLMIGILRMLEASLSMHDSVVAVKIIEDVRYKELLTRLRRIDKQVGQLVADNTKQALLQATPIVHLVPDESIREFAVKQQSALNRLWVHGPDGRARRVPIEDLFVPLAVLQFDRDHQKRPLRTTTPVQFDNFLRLFSRAVILGDPGGGKSTFGQRLCLEFSRLAQNGLEKLPIRIVIREYEAAIVKNSNIVLFDFITSEMRRLDPNLTEIQIHDVMRNMLLFGRVCLFFDGLDEIVETSRRRRFVEEVESFADAYPLCPVLITSRAIGYDQAPLHGDYEIFHLTQFERDQSLSYFEKVSISQFGLSKDEAVEEVRAFDAKIGVEAADLVSNPLLLSLMCWLYHERRGDVPNSKARIYEECSLLMFQRWDLTRSIDTPQIAEAVLFDLITALAAEVYQEAALAGGISKAWLTEFCEKFFFRMFDVDRVPRSKIAAQDLVGYLTGRAWVLSEKGSGVFDFTHRTFLEYFFSRHLVDIHQTVRELIDRTFQKVRKGQWHLPVSLALQHYARLHRQSSRTIASTIVMHLEKGKDTSKEMKRQHAKRGRAVAGDVLAFAAEGCEYLNLTEAELGTYVESLWSYGLNVPDGVTKFASLLKGASERKPTIVSKMIECIVKGVDGQKTRSAGAIADTIRAFRYFLWFDERELQQRGFRNMRVSLDRARRQVETSEWLGGRKDFRKGKLVYDLVGVSEVVELQKVEEVAEWSSMASASWFLVDCITVVEGLTRARRDALENQTLLDACEFGKKIAPGLLTMAPLNIAAGTLVWTGAFTGIEDVCAVCRSDDRAAAVAALVFTLAALDLYGEWPSVARFSRGKEAEVIKAKRRLTSAYLAGALNSDPYAKRITEIAAAGVPIVRRPARMDGILPKDFL